jgi:hypothetical protein
MSALWSGGTFKSTTGSRRVSNTSQIAPFCDRRHSAVNADRLRSNHRKQSLIPKQETPMRTFFNVAIIALFALTFWFGSHTVAKQNADVSMDPYWMTTNTTDIATAPQYDLY